MEHERILVIDFGGQYNQLILRRVRERNVLAEVVPYTISLEEIKEKSPKGIIFTGGSNSVYGKSALDYDKGVFDLGIPILGICYGAQLMAHALGGKVETAPTSEYGSTEILREHDAILLKDVSQRSIAWMSHTDYIAQVPDGFQITATTPVCPVAAMEDPARGFYATQFHPEVMHTEEGETILRTFIEDVCNCIGDWKMDSFVASSIEEIRKTVGDGKVLCALSGGVDSSVAAVMLSKAVGRQLTTQIGRASCRERV